MPVYRNILTALHALLATLFGVFVTERDRFVAVDPAYGGYAYLAVLFGLFFLFRYAHVLSDLIIERIPGFSPWLRRTLAGKSCIEGDWPLAVVSHDERTGRTELAYIGYLTIDYAGGQLRVSGRDWHPDGRFAHDFESQQSRLSANCLQYWYYQGQDGRMRGYTEIYFFPKDALAERHAGEFRDQQHIAVRFYARKRPANVRRPRSEKERLQMAREFWSSIAPDIETIVGREVSADWE